VDGDGGFLVEDFLEAIASQLDRTQDALRLKAAVRPLTYALKDFQLELKVFVSMDADGNVRFRGAGPNEDGASTVQFGFTTITRPMIEENTVSLAVSKTPTLEEMGLDSHDRQRLQRLGVRNAGQLQELGSATGASGVSRASGIPIDVLRAALHRVRPRVAGIEVQTDRSGTRKTVPMPTEQVPPANGRDRLRPTEPTGPTVDRRAALPPDSLKVPPTALPPSITLPAGARRLVLRGPNLTVGRSTAALDGQQVDVQATGDDGLVVHLPHSNGGTLSLDLDGEVLSTVLHPERAERLSMPFGQDAAEPPDPWQSPVSRDGAPG